MRAMRRVGKIAVAAAATLVALSGCGAPSDRGAASGDVAGPVDIGGGRHLYLTCRGSGAPTIVLESGYHNSADPWTQSDAAVPAVGPAVLPALAADHRVCAYDRPGTLRYADPPTLTDRSSPAAMPRTAHDVVEDLHALLAAAHVPGPYVLAGHSLGGLFARLYAQTFPDQVRAVVFVDAFAVEIPGLMGSNWPAYRRMLDRPLPQFTDSSVYEEIDIDKSVEQVAAAPAFPAIPTVVLSRTEPFAVPPEVPPEQGAALEQAWRDATASLIGLRPQTPHLIATGSDHFVQIHQPDLVVAGIRLALRRSGG